jgi:PAS domain S-box-containing protein
MRGYCLLDQKQNILSQDDFFNQFLLSDVTDRSNVTIGELFDTTFWFDSLLERVASRKVVPAIHRPSGIPCQLEIVPLHTEQGPLFVLLVEERSPAQCIPLHSPTDYPGEIENLVGGEKTSDLDLFFEVSPLPMWIFNTESLKFVAVNEAAVRKYGWSRQEFLDMTILDIRPEAERELVERIVSGCFTRVGRSGPWLHQSRSGETWSVDALTHAVSFRGLPCRLVKVLDAPNEQALVHSTTSMGNANFSLNVVDARETRIVEMKKEINDLLSALGREPKFNSVLN